jgi:hypothetical protein
MESSEDNVANKRYEEKIEKKMEDVEESKDAQIILNHIKNNFLP